MMPVELFIAVVIAAVLLQIIVDFKKYNKQGSITQYLDREEQIAYDRINRYLLENDTDLILSTKTFITINNASIFDDNKVVADFLITDLDFTLVCLVDMKYNKKKAKRLKNAGIAYYEIGELL